MPKHLYTLPSGTALPAVTGLPEGYPFIVTDVAGDTLHVIKAGAWSAITSTGGGGGGGGGGGITEVNGLTYDANAPETLPMDWTKLNSADPGDGSWTVPAADGVFTHFSATGMPYQYTAATDTSYFPNPHRNITTDVVDGLYSFVMKPVSTHSHLDMFFPVNIVNSATVSFDYFVGGFRDDGSNDTTLKAYADVDTGSGVSSVEMPVAAGMDNGPVWQTQTMFLPAGTTRLRFRVDNEGADYTGGENPRAAISNVKIFPSGTFPSTPTLVYDTRTKGFYIGHDQMWESADNDVKRRLGILAGLRPYGDTSGYRGTGWAATATKVVPPHDGTGVFSPVVAALVGVDLNPGPGRYFFHSTAFVRFTPDVDGSLILKLGARSTFPDGTGAYLWLTNFSQREVWVDVIAGTTYEIPMSLFFTFARQYPQKTDPTDPDTDYSFAAAMDVYAQANVFISRTTPDPITITVDNQRSWVTAMLLPVIGT